jgi:hypothetical protein
MAVGSPDQIPWPEQRRHFALDPDQHRRRPDQARLCPGDQTGRGKRRCVRAEGHYLSAQAMIAAPVGGMVWPVGYIEGATLWSVRCFWRRKKPPMGWTMDRLKSAAEARRSLDRIRAPYRPTFPRRPPRGWIRAIRDAFGMSAGQLGAQMAVTQPTVQKPERSEQGGAIQLNSLRRAASPRRWTASWSTCSCPASLWSGSMRRLPATSPAGSLGRSAIPWRLRTRRSSMPTRMTVCDASSKTNWIPAKFGRRELGRRGPARRQCRRYESLAG